MVLLDATKLIGNSNYWFLSPKKTPSITEIYSHIVCGYIIVLFEFHIS